MLEIIRKYLKGDRIIWIVIIALSLISLLAVYSSTGTLAYKYQGGNTFYYFMKHTIFLCMGLFIVFITHLIPYRYYSWLSQLFLIIAIPLLLFTFLSSLLRILSCLFFTFFLLFSFLKNESPIAKSF